MKHLIMRVAGKHFTGIGHRGSSAVLPGETTEPEPHTPPQCHTHASPGRGAAAVGRQDAAPDATMRMKQQPCALVKIIRKLQVLTNSS